MGKTDNVFKVLSDRGFVKQTTSEQLDEILAKPVTCYAGFDPTAESLHVGSLMPIMALAHMQRAGHRPIALVGGATAMIGDPSGKDKVRSMLSTEDILHNMTGIREQLSRFVDFTDGRALLVNNADWIGKLEYIPFLREIGIHFSVNRMLTAECFRARMEKEAGLSFLELNYMLLQGYDFLHLYRAENCILQIGGDDQWSNILAGADLIRRTEQKEAYGLTLPLIVTATGAKMGKTEKGALWLDESRSSINDFYQYWRNTDDRDLAKFLKFFTFMDLSDIEEMCGEKDTGLNKVKSVLAFQITRTVHNEEKALKALVAEKELFGIQETDFNYIAKKVNIDAGSAVSSATPQTSVAAADLENGVGLLDILVQTGLTVSKGEGRRMIKQGGAYVNGERQTDPERLISTADVQENGIELRLGKKKFHRIAVS